jgi:hypothetical protein
MQQASHLQSSVALKHVFDAYCDRGDAMSSEAYLQFVRDCPELLTSRFDVISAMTPLRALDRDVLELNNFTQVLFQISLLRYPEAGSSCVHLSGRSGTETTVSKSNNRLPPALNRPPPTMQSG